MFHNFFIHALLKSKPINQAIDLSNICKNIDFLLLISGFQFGYDLEYIEMLNDAKVASLGFFKG